MSRLKKDPLRRLQCEERSRLARVSRALGLPAALVARAKVLLAVANGSSYTAAAQLAGRDSRRTWPVDGYPRGFTSRCDISVWSCAGLVRGCITAMTSRAYRGPTMRLNSSIRALRP